MTTHVNFSTAKLLKEKEFQEPCSRYYIVDFQNFKADGVLYNCGIPVIRRKNQPHLCNAPIIAEVVMWLYEKHGIWIEVNLGDYGFYWTVMSKDKNIIAESKYRNVFNSPTETYETAILYTLNNLI